MSQEKRVPHPERIVKASTMLKTGQTAAIVCDLENKDLYGQLIAQHPELQVLMHAEGPVPNTYTYKVKKL